METLKCPSGFVRVYGTNNCITPAQAKYESEAKYRTEQDALAKQRAQERSEQYEALRRSAQQMLLLKCAVVAVVVGGALWWFSKGKP
jgi:hypothetical protein